MRPGAGTPSPAVPHPLLPVADPHFSLLTVQEGSAPRFEHTPPPKPPTLPGRAFATGPRAQRRRRARKALQRRVAPPQGAP